MLEKLFSVFETPPAVERSAEDQRRVDAETSGWSLYYFDGCFFCSRVHRAIDRLSLHIELRNIYQDRRHYDDLVRGGGRSTVPCLRIPGAGSGAPDTWMYESAEIVAFLEDRFAAPREPTP